MLLGALLDAGADLDAVRDAVASLGIPGLSVDVLRERRGGFACARVVVGTPAVPDRERRLADVLELLDTARLRAPARRLAGTVFTLLAGAEGAVHGLGPGEVHFHEVGAFDALADVVGVAAACDALGLLADGAATWCSPLAVGHGTVRSAHGPLPVPGPAVLRLAADAGAGADRRRAGGRAHHPDRCGAGRRARHPRGAARHAGHGRRRRRRAPGSRRPSQHHPRRAGAGRRRRRAPGTRRGRGRRGHGRRSRPATVALGARRRPGGRRLGLLDDARDRPARPSRSGALGAVPRGGPGGRRPGRVPAHEHLRRPVVALGAGDRAPPVGAGRGRPGGRGPGGDGEGRRADDPGDPDAPLPLATPELAEAEEAAAALGWPVRAVLEAALAAYREQA